MPAVTAVLRFVLKVSVDRTFISSKSGNCTSVDVHPDQWNHSIGWLSSLALREANGCELELDNYATILLFPFFQRVCLLK